MIVMLPLHFDEIEVYDEERNLFETIREQTIYLEHSLVSLAKWESKWHKPYLSDDEKTPEEILDYIRCMTVTPNVNPIVYKMLTPEHIKAIEEYINDKMTATWFKETKNVKRKEVITAEIIYYWMISLQIPVEFQKWHLNRLLTLIKVCNSKNQPKKMSKREILSRNRELNKARRNKFNTKG